jgi:type VI protein secretion system component Hcp
MSAGISRRRGATASAVIGVAALAAGLVFGGSGSAAAKALPSSVRGFLTLSDNGGHIDGGSTFRREEKTIEITGYQISFHNSGGNFCDPTIIKTGYNQAWPILAQDAVQDAGLPIARLDLWKTGGRSEGKFLQYTFDSASLLEVDETDATSEVLTLSIGGIEEKSWAQRADGSLGSPTTRSFSCVNT